ncbi:hypothetical protein WN55_04224 [Dufourea novaeangliae]|uniref:Uncharacterized protein n=1 Tax=Dufourea novaeangliae TaxID=178035 RepID=A0A154NXL1_DUFNO|nr:hypothetical protein WN55_04224 [Dufourea novaeangliae]
MSCSEVMYQYYPYLYQRPPPPPHPTHPHAAPHTHPHGNPHAAHHSPARPAPFQSFSAATATHQYDRLPSVLLAAGLKRTAPLPDQVLRSSRRGGDVSSRYRPGGIWPA